MEANPDDEPDEEPHTIALLLGVVKLSVALVEDIQYVVTTDATIDSVSGETPVYLARAIVLYNGGAHLRHTLSGTDRLHTDCGVRLSANPVWLLASEGFIPIGHVEWAVVKWYLMVPLLVPLPTLVTTVQAFVGLAFAPVQVQREDRSGTWQQRPR